MSKRFHLFVRKRPNAIFRILCSYMYGKAIVQSRIFTAHKRSLGKVMFLHLSVILFTGGRRGFPWQRLPHRTGISKGRDPPDRDPHPWTENPPDRDPLGRDSSPLYGKERAVRTLLECILVILLLKWITFSIYDFKAMFYRTRNLILANYMWSAVSR